MVAVDEYTDGTKVYEYVFGARRYLCVGDRPSPPPPGISFPVVKAETGGNDVTEVFKKYAGPKTNHVPDTGYIFFRRVPVVSVKSGRGLRLELKFGKEKGESKEIYVKNALGQASVFGAR